MSHEPLQTCLINHIIFGWLRGSSGNVDWWPVTRLRHFVKDPHFFLATALAVLTVQHGCCWNRWNIAALWCWSVTLWDVTISFINKGTNISASSRTSATTQSSNSAPTYAASVSFSEYKHWTHKYLELYNYRYLVLMLFLPMTVISRSAAASSVTLSWPLLW